MRIALWTLGVFFVLALVLGALGGWLGALELGALGVVSLAVAVALVRRRPRGKAG
jgi:hypothetical protein